MAPQLTNRISRFNRVAYVREDAGETGEVWAAVPPRTPPEWHCECGARNDGWRMVCCYCGDWREDADEWLTG